MERLAPPPAPTITDAWVLLQTDAATCTVELEHIGPGLVRIPEPIARDWRKGEGGRVLFVSLEWQERSEG